MLTNVHVKNLALIEESEIELKKGFNILTGETGAGKSIIIGSINYCLGAKADKDVIREGAEYALVELMFQVDDKATLDEVKRLDIPVEEDGSLLLTRKIQPARSIFRVNGETVTAKQMKELATLLIDIHGQHDHQSLLSESKQKGILDDFGGEELAKIKEEISKLYTEIKSVEKEIEDFDTDENVRARDISLAQYELDEIENAALVAGEEIELNRKHSLMMNGMKIKKNLANARECLQGEDNGALTQVGYAVRELGIASGMDENLDAISSHLSDAEQVLMDVYKEIRDYMDELDFDDEEFGAVEERIDIINRLSLKYGSTTEEIIAYGEAKRVELEKLMDGENYLESLRSKKEKLRKKYEDCAKKAHELRCIEADRLSGDITASLEELNFLKVNFTIEVLKADSESGYGTDGYDTVRFMISLNPGEKLKPLSEVASGGELSRIMLSLKTVLASRDNIDTLIFDEIDTGISGFTAWAVSKKMGELSKQHQIICITHLPQIAAMADTHFKIEKYEKDGRTVTSLSHITGDDHIDEIGRLLGGEDISDTVRANAIELIKKAGKI